MRPILLQITGLQSYRELQEIDFAALTGAGVFGIFGPTGSGKSSLLDAITLALYGKVERAPGGTQSVMNQAEDVLAVSFSFELAAPGGAIRYRVDRQFKRNGDQSMLGSLCRLIRQQDGETVVLADKAGEVNHQVQELLGLSMADFTRAVVLPQGKFAEFLTLAGKDRRAMLQRLFHLEPYGDRLSAKTASRYKQADAGVKQLQAEQQGLGDASQEALALAEARLAEAQAAARAAREALTACEQLAAEQRAVRELQRERGILAARGAALAADAPRIAALAARLARAAEAERLRPLVRRRAAARAQLAGAQAASAAAGEALAAAQRSLAAAEAAHQAARDALAAQEAPLAARLEQLRYAAELAAELAAARERLAVLAAEASRADAGLAAQRAEEARERGLREKAQQRQAQLKTELARVETPAAVRTRLQDALQAARELERTEALAAERQAAASGQRQEAARERLRLQEQAEREQAWSGRAAAWLAHAGSLRQAAGIVEARLLELEQAAAREEELRRRRDLAAEREAMAEALAAQLQDGEECPVCGSKEHPALERHRVRAVPKQPDDGEAESVGPAGAAGMAAWEAGAAGQRKGMREAGGLPDDAAELEHSRKRTREEQFAVRQLLQRLDSLERQCAQLHGSAAGADAQAELLEARLQAAAGRSDQSLGSAAEPPRGSEMPFGVHTGERQPEHLAAYPKADIFLPDFVDLLEHLSPEFPASLSSAHSDCAGALRRFEQRADELEKQWQELLQHSRQGERKRQELETRLQTLEAAIAAEEAKAGEWLQALASQREAWQRAYAEWEPARVPELAEQGRLQEAAAEDIRQRLETSVAFLQEKESRLQQLQLEQSGLEKQAVRLAAEKEALEGQFRQQTERLHGLVGDGELGSLAAEATASLQRLRGEAEASAGRREQALAAHQSASAHEAAARQAEQSAEALDAQTQSEWLEQSGAAGFTAAAEVEEALVSDEQRSAWTLEVEGHGKQEHQVNVRLQELDVLLAGRSVTDEAWELTESRLAASKSKDEEALQAAARAERDCEALREKHGRWQELERERESLQQELTLLGKLQGVLRGNAFVEFLAEEQLMHVSRVASERLGQLTRRKYAIEVDSGSGFVIRDDANGGTRRPVTTLSGGETFLTSLSLALALSTQIQLKGEYPLEFFFLDEGFGTLDPDLLDAVVTALEKLHVDNLTVGVISHVPELRARLPRRLVVQPAEPGGRGSRVVLETM
ncbi:AAA family ATPase [Paenibacillus puerhi]|uniref:AAA family ATPase n=1 Tax=Paenibacillus puerhi TaxID=2692622 RepID=UPI00135BB20A|nr:SMC family ATPase [Paenibacillus puerhi]